MAYGELTKVVVLVIFVFIHCGYCNRRGRPSTCPQSCFCNTISKIVYCSRRGLTAIPEHLPEGTKQLNLNGNLFDVPVLHKSNLTSATNLGQLYLSECGIERIAVGTFTDMTNLQWLDLSKNRITRIEDYTFKGLSLMHLFLSGNTNLNIQPKAFRDMQSNGLYLQECSLSQLQFEVFRPLNGTLKYLWLNGNALSRINKKFRSIFGTLSHLRIGTNPLHCNCESQWLKEFYDTKTHIFAGSEFPSCLTPSHLRNKHFNNISLSDFKCSPPTFKNIDVVLEENDKMLRCTASGDPMPTLYWVSPAGVSIKYSPNTDNIKYNQAILNITALKTAHKQDISGQYFCLAINDAGNMTFTFNVTWPRDVAGTSVTPTMVPSTITRSTIVNLPEDQTSTQNSVKDSGHSSVTRTTVDTTHNNGVKTVDSDTDTGNKYEEINDIGKYNSVRTNKTMVVSSEVPVSSPGEVTHRLYTLTELIGAIIGTLACTLLLALIILSIFLQSKWKNRNNSLEKPPLKEDVMYLPPIVSAGNQYESKISKPYRDYYFDSPSPIKR